MVSPLQAEEGEERPLDSVMDTPTGPPGWRKTRIMREAETTMALPGELESSQEREAREARESSEMFEEICRIIGDNGSLCEEFDYWMVTL